MREAHDRQRGERFPRTGLADQTDFLARAHSQAYSRDRFGGSEPDVQVLNAKDRLARVVLRSDIHGDIHSGARPA
ncbi:hypothetical protein [Microbacterium alcoholitolerans]|uniref:hypothetical protein n=1 Tax=unclassified Microbacterium TaxID=2609290 RepID=UPI003D17EA0D